MRVSFLLSSLLLLSSSSLSVHARIGGEQEQDQEDSNVKNHNNKFQIPPIPRRRGLQNVTTTITTTTTVQDTEPALAVSWSGSAMNGLMDNFRQVTIPSIIDTLNENWSDAIDRFCATVVCFNVEFRTLNLIRDMLDLNLEFLSSPSSTSSTTTNNNALVARFSLTNARAEPQIIVENNLCRLDGYFNIIIPSVSIDVEVAMEDNNTEGGVGKRFLTRILDISMPRADGMFFMSDSSSMTFCENFVQSAFVEFGALNLRERLKPLLLNALQQRVGTRSFTLPGRLFNRDMSVGDSGATLRMDTDINLFGARNDNDDGTNTNGNNGFGFRAQVLWTATLNEPSFRAGSSYTPMYVDDSSTIASSTNAIAFPIARKLFNANIASTALNRLMESLWYISWGNLVDDPRGMESELCTPAPNDPCPFPAYMRKQRSFFTQILMLRFGKFYRSQFPLEIVMLPPTVQFDNGQIIGSTSARVKIYGEPFFATSSDDVEDIGILQVGINVIASLPQFGQDGRFFDMNIVSLELQTPELLTAQENLATNVRRRIVELVTNRLNATLRNVQDRINESFRRILENVPALNIPTLENVPWEGMRTIFDLIDTELTGIRADDSDEENNTNQKSSSMLYVGADININVEEE